MGKIINFLRVEKRAREKRQKYNDEIRMRVNKWEQALKQQDFSELHDYYRGKFEVDYHSYQSEKTLAGFLYRADQHWKKKEFREYLKYIKDYGEIQSCLSSISFDGLKFPKIVYIAKEIKSGFINNRITEIKYLFQYEEVIKSFYSNLKLGKFKNAYDDYITSLNLKGKMRVNKAFLLNEKNEKDLKTAVEIVVIKLIDIIKKKVLDLGTKFTRLEVKEISEICRINHEEIIISTVKEMIKNKEIYAEYFSSSRAVAFNQQANIDEIDRLMDAYKKWEEKKVGKK